MEIDPAKDHEFGWLYGGSYQEGSSAPIVDVSWLMDNGGAGDKKKKGRGIQMVRGGAGGSGSPVGGGAGSTRQPAAGGRGSIIPSLEESL